MAEVKRNATLVARYEQTRAQVRANQVIDVAEDILGHAWVDRLADRRRAVSDAVRASGETAQAAWQLVRQAETDGAEHEIAGARRLLGAAREDLGEELITAQRKLAEIDAQLQRVHRAALDRLARRRADFDRLQAAHTAAFGAEQT